MAYRIRIYQLARELNLSSKEVIAKAQAFGLSHIRSHANSLAESDALLLKEHISQAIRPPQRPVVLRRRTTHVSQDTEWQMSVTRLAQDHTQKLVEVKRIQVPKTSVIPEDLAIPLHQQDPQEVTEALTMNSFSQTTVPPVEPLDKPTQKEGIAKAYTQETTVQQKTNVSKSSPKLIEVETASPQASPKQQATLSDTKTPSTKPKREAVKNQATTKQQSKESFTPAVVVRMLPHAQAQALRKGPHKKTVYRVTPKLASKTAKTSTPASPQQPQAPPNSRKSKKHDKQRLSRAERKLEQKRRLNQPSPHKRKSKTQTSKLSRQAQIADLPKRFAANGSQLLKIEGSISFRDLAHRMGIKVRELLAYQLTKGNVLTPQQILQFQEAEAVVKEFGFSLQNTAFSLQEKVKDLEASSAENVVKNRRAPIVAMMGHVDHGKTSLLDAIRKTRHAQKEAGGITQHLGASVVQSQSKRKIVFLDTPGHQAFTSMRKNGANCTDIVVLVVAADDGVMPQTIESIKLAQQAGVEIVVAINKSDRPNARPDRIRQALSHYQLIPEEWGGMTQMIEVSALNKTGIDLLLDAIHLQADMLTLQAAPNRSALGTVLESKMLKGRGSAVSVIVQEGTLRKGDYLVIGGCYGKAKAIYDEHTKSLKKAGPSTPVQILGVKGLPQPGQRLYVVDSEKEAQKMANAHTQIQEPTNESPFCPPIPWDTQKKLSFHLVLKADTRGTLKVLKEALQALRYEQIQIEVKYASVGNITINDVRLASLSDARVIGFGVQMDGNAQKLAQKEQVHCQLDDVIFTLLDEIKLAMTQQLSPIVHEQVTGELEVRKIFHIPKVGKIAGCYVSNGSVKNDAHLRLYRDQQKLYEGKVVSLKRLKSDITSAASGTECGLQLDGIKDLQEGDKLEAYNSELRPAVLIPIQ